MPQRNVYKSCGFRPPAMLFLGPESPCRGPWDVGKPAAPGALPSLWPRTAPAAATLPLKCSPQSSPLLQSLLHYPSLQMQGCPDKLQCREQIQAVIPEGTGPVKPFSAPPDALPFLAEPSTGADAGAQPGPAPQGLPALSSAQK